MIALAGTAVNRLSTAPRINFVRMRLFLSRADWIHRTLHGPGEALKGE
jgi:hypothetical protein